MTQSIVLAATLQVGTARLTQSFLIAAVGVGIACGSPPAGQVNVPYSHTFPVGGGDPPYTFSIIAGVLPPGLTLNASTGVVSGTPRGPISPGQVFSFTIQVTDSLSATAAVACSISISSLDLIINFIGAKVYAGR